MLSERHRKGMEKVNHNQKRTPLYSTWFLLSRRGQSLQLLIAGLIKWLYPINQVNAFVDETNLLMNNTLINMTKQLQLSLQK